MQTRTRVVDASGTQYLVEPSSLRSSCDGDLVVRVLYPDGTVGLPMRLPDCSLRVEGAVFLRIGGNAWIATDERLRIDHRRRIDTPTRSSPDAAEADAGR